MIAIAVVCVLFLVHFYADFTLSGALDPLVARIADLSVEKGFR
jgi:hypothetical protein